MSEYKVLIPSAGLGTRLFHLSQNLNKALISVNHKPVISHVIEKFPLSVGIVIALGYKGALVRDYVELAHPDRDIHFVEVYPFEGPDAGLGLTMLRCKDLLQCPFVFCPNDTIVTDDIPEPLKNWAAYAEIENTEHYRSLKINASHQVSEVCEKDDRHSRDQKPYTGLLGVKDYKEFWKFMEEGQAYGAIQLGETYALRRFVEAKIPVYAQKVTWLDTGNVERLMKTRAELASSTMPTILEKDNEAIWFANGRVIKYNADPDFITSRVLRAEHLRDYVPQVTGSRQHMYSYRMLVGNVMSRVVNTSRFERLLDYLQTFWEKKSLEEDDETIFLKACEKFYKEKTRQRVDLYFNKFSQQDKTETINGESVPPLADLLKKIDWADLCNGTAVRFHGDLHFENILVNETGRFYLLDWRQDFGGLSDYGDIYYDLAKLLHGMIVSHELINKECYDIEQRDDIIRFDIYRKYSLVESEKQFYAFMNKNGYDIKKVKILTALIYLNIAALHHYPYSKLLFYLGKMMLFKELLDE